ncbi:hypothetical protein PAMP_003376 [Pampus punctatissimus]
MAERVLKHLENSVEPITELGSDVKARVQLPIFHQCAPPGGDLEHVDQFLEECSVRFHMLVTLLNTSGVTFADSLSRRRPGASLTVNDIMLTRDSLHPTTYGLLLANKLGLRPLDVKCKVDEPEPRLELEPERKKGAIAAEKSKEGSAQASVEVDRVSHEDPLHLGRSIEEFMTRRGLGGRDTIGAVQFYDDRLVSYCKRVEMNYSPF